jgi:hypothetical protein
MTYISMTYWQIKRDDSWAQNLMMFTFTATFRRETCSTIHIIYPSFKTAACLRARLQLDKKDLWSEFKNNHSPLHRFLVPYCIIIISLLENVSLRVPTRHVRDFSTFSVCPSKGAFRPVRLAPSCRASAYASTHAIMRASSLMPLLDACACPSLFTPW